MLIHGIELYDPDIQLIPEYNWQKFNRCILMKTNIGSSVEDILRKADSIASFADRPEDLRNELNSFKLALYSCMQLISFDSMAFACLVKTIDGEKVEIKTDEQIASLSNLIIETGITHEEIAEYTELLKKKLMHR